MSRFSQNNNFDGNRGHIPVLLHEVIEYLALEPGKLMIDATLDGGGHARAILEQYPAVALMGIEYDPVEFEQFRREQPELAASMVLVNDSYINLERIVSEHSFQPDGVLLDLGISSWHLEMSGRGFSFQKDEPLDMRFNPREQKTTAAELVNTVSESELTSILEEYGEEQFAPDISAQIVRRRREHPILTTTVLSEIISATVPSWYKCRKINPATKTFQALRIAVNDELNALRQGITAAIKVLRPGGRIVVISFQGLEDKIVREVFQKYTATGQIKWVTKRTIRPSWDEIKNNPRSRSAKMKIAEKISG